MDDVIFAHNQPGKHDTIRAYTQIGSPGGSTGAKSDACDCRVLLEQAYIVHVHNIRQIWNIVCCLECLRLGLGQWDSDAELYRVIVISVAFTRLTLTNY